ncbi:hypothetical protein [Burkholderia cepacia]|nr:hypothetical protein [Burkholderia cepacia]
MRIMLNSGVGIAFMARIGSIAEGRASNMTSALLSGPTRTVPDV